MLFRLTPDLRVLKSGDYQAIFKQGKMTKGKYWKIIAKKTNTTPRLGLAISKKSHKLAVERNHLKRIAREVFRIHQDELKNWEFVVMTKPAKPTNNAIITQDLLDLFKQATHY